MTYPSVTQILSPWNTFAGVRPEVLEAAAARGSRVHLACSNYVSGFMVPDMPGGEQLYYNSSKRWFDATVEETISVEAEYKCGVYHFQGHPDCVAILKGSPDIWVLDWKTPRTLSRSFRLQIAAYSHLTQSQRGATLRLSPEGKKAILDESSNLLHDFSIFLNCLTAYKFFNE